MKNLYFPIQIYTDYHYDSYKPLELNLKIGTHPVYFLAIEINN